MRSASDAFARALAASHTLSTRVDVLFNRTVIEEGLAVVDGSIYYDRGAARLAQLDCTFADPVRIPTGPSDVLTPYGYELRVWRGVTFPDGSSEMVALGTFPIQQSRVSVVDRITSVSAMDRSQLVSDARFLDDYLIAANTNIATAIEDMIDAGVGGLEFLFPTTTYTTPQVVLALDNDRWEEAQRMARSIGHEVYFEGLGRPTMRPEPTFDTEPVATIEVGANMIDAGVNLDRGPAVNGVVAYSSNASTGAQYRGFAYDDDPQSPTFYSATRFGLKERGYASPFINSDEQAESAAQAILASNLGVAKSVNFSAVPDPRLECSDVVRITCADLGLDDLHIIETLSIGLGPEAPLTGTSRAQEGVATVG